MNIFTEQVLEFKILLPLIMAMGNKDFKPKHWKLLADNVDPRFGSKNFITNELITHNVLDHKEFIVDISQKATGEALIKNQLSNIEKKWEELNFNIVELDDFSSSFKLSRIEDVMQYLDEHSVLL